MQIENEYNAMSKLLANEGGHIKLNKKLISIIGLEATCVYSELFNLQYEAIKKDDCQLIDNNPYFSMPTDKLSGLLSISAHKQRSILQVLQDKKLISVYYGSGNSRMISVSADYYNLYEILNPTMYPKQFLFDNFVANINSLKKLLVKNIEQNRTHKNMNFKKDFLEYLENYNNKDYKFEKEIIKFLTEETIEKELTKEYSKLCG